eukprot:scaffold524_cov357-Pavlova_lutheri.AAC.5
MSFLIRGPTRRVSPRPTYYVSERDPPVWNCPSSTWIDPVTVVPAHVPKGTSVTTNQGISLRPWEIGCSNGPTRGLGINQGRSEGWVDGQIQRILITTRNSTRCSSGILGQVGDTHQSGRPVDETSKPKKATAQSSVVSVQCRKSWTKCDDPSQKVAYG